VVIFETLRQFNDLSLFAVECSRIQEIIKHLFPARGQKKAFLPDCFVLLSRLGRIDSWTGSPIFLSVFDKQFTKSCADLSRLQEGAELSYKISQTDPHDSIDIRDILSGSDALDLLEYIHGCQHCDSLESLKRYISSLGKILPFEHLISSIVTTDSVGQVLSHETLNVSYPEEWMACYFEQKFELIDPIVRHNFKNFTFAHWDEIPGYKEKYSSFWDMAATFGMDNGCVYGLKHSGANGGTLFSFSGDELQHKRHETIIKHVVPHLDIRLRLLTNTSRFNHPALTKRELEVLNWVKAGKSNWEISAILGISERTVKFHVSSILDKLNTVNRSQAVAAAIEAGIIGY